MSEWDGGSSVVEELNEGLGAGKADAESIMGRRTRKSGGMGGGGVVVCSDGGASRYGGDGGV